MTAALRSVWLVLVGLHLALWVYAVPLDVVFGVTPFGGPDYQTHFQHAHTLLQVRAEFGEAWAYDPNLLAGHPTGLIFDVDNKLHFGWTRVLAGMGVPLAIAFNLFAWLSCLLAPVSLWLAAKLLGGDAWHRVVAFGVGVLVWQYDPTVRFCWAGGMISFATAAHLAPVLIAAMVRLVRGTGGRWAPVVVVAMLPLLLRLHVWSFVILVVPLTMLYLGAVRRLPWSTHVTVWLAAALGILANLDWLLPALAHRHLIVPSAGLGQATPQYLLYDFLEQLVDPLRTGFVFQRTFLRAVVVIAAAGTVVMWSRTGDSRARIGGLTLAWLVGLTYFGALVPPLPATEPYRFAVPMVLWACVWAGPWLQTAVANLRHVHGPARAAVVVLVVLLVPRLYQQVIPFVPELNPSPQPTGQAARSLPVARLHGVLPETEAVRAWLAEQPQVGRVLVQYGPLGEYLRWASDWPVLGGFYDRRMIFQDANLFYFKSEDPRYGPGFADYLERYNVSHVVMTYPHIPKIESRHDLLAPGGIVGGIHRVYAVRRPSGYFAEGTGEVTAGLNRIDVRAATPAPGSEHVVLRFHFMAGLRCSSGCRVEQVPVAGDTAGFIRVVGTPTLPSEFSLTLAYGDT